MKPKIGDRVQWSAKWLKSIKAPATDELWQMKGTIKSMNDGKPFLIAKVQWDNEPEEKGCRVDCLKVLHSLEAD